VLDPEHQVPKVPGPLWTWIFDPLGSPPPQHTTHQLFNGWRDLFWIQGTPQRPSLKTDRTKDASCVNFCPSNYNFWDPRGGSLSPECIKPTMCWSFCKMTFYGSGAHMGSSRSSNGAPRGSKRIQKVFQRSSKWALDYPREP